MPFNLVKFSCGFLFFAVGLGASFVRAQQTVPLPTIQHISQHEALWAEDYAKGLSQNWEGESIRRALELFLQAANQWEQLGDKARSSTCLREASKLELMRGNAAISIVLLKKALQFELDSESVSGKVETLSQLLTVAPQMGQIKESEGYYQQILTLAEKSESPQIRATALFAAGEFFYYKRDIGQNISYQEKALQLFREARNRRGEAETLVSLAYAYVVNNEPTIGLTRAQEALAISQELGDKRGEAFALIALANVHRVMDESQAALDAYIKAESLFPDGLNLIEKARVYNGISPIYEDYGEWQQSLRYAQKALDIFVKIEHKFGQILTLINLGRISNLGKDRSLALIYLNRARQLADEIGNEYDLALVHKELANIYLTDGSGTEALKYYQQSLKLFRKLNFKIDIAQILSKIGQLYEQEGKIELARIYYLSALETNRAIKSRFAEAETLFSLARLDVSQNQTESALKQLEESLHLTESLRGDIANNKLRRTYLAQVYERYEFYIDLLMEMHARFPHQGFNAQAFQVSERARSRTLIESLRLSGMRLSEGVDPELQQREKNVRAKLNLKADALTQLLSAPNPQKGKTDQLNNEIEELTNEYEVIRAELKAASPLYALLNQPFKFDLRQFQNEILDEQSLLMEFSLRKKRSFLWLVERNEITTVELPAQSVLEERIRRLLGMLTERQIRAGEELEEYQKRLAAAEKDYERESLELSEILLKPVAEKIKGKRLLIVPDSALHYLPLSALPLPWAPKNAPLILEHEIVYQSSAATLLFLAQNTKPVFKNAKTILVFADPVFSPRDERLTASSEGETNQKETVLASASFENIMRSAVGTGESLPRLFASQKEATAISDLIGLSQATIVSGAAANRQRLFEPDVANYRIVHFATHGLFNEEKPELSGIVLSLYDERGQRQEGFLRLHDIYDLNLSSELVVLSACQSGIGREVRGEGIIGLTRGFLQAGSRSVLSSMWKVDDEATAELMKHFYQGLFDENLSAAEALRLAQLKLRRNPRWQSPFYWAAFTLQGEYRHPVIAHGRQISLSFLPAAIGFLLAVIFIGFIAVRKYGSLISSKKTIKQN